EFPEATTRESASDREGQSDELAPKEWRQSHKKPDSGSRVRTGNQSSYERSFEREISRVIPQKQPGDHGDRQRNAEIKCEDEPVGPVSTLENENVTEAPVPHQHRG